MLGSCAQTVKCKAYNMNAGCAVHGVRLFAFGWFLS